MDQKVTTTATKQRALTQLTTNNVESGIGGLRSVAGHQAERADSMLPVEAMKYSANAIADVNYQHEHCTGKLRDRNKCVPKHVSVIRRVKKSEAIDGNHGRMTGIPSENVPCALETWQHWGQLARKVRWFRRHASSESVSHVEGKSSKSTSHRAQTSPDHDNPGRVFPHRHG